VVKVAVVVGDKGVAIAKVKACVERAGRGGEGVGTFFLFSPHCWFSLRSLFSLLAQAQKLDRVPRKIFSGLH
jgi:hypothetical protein